MYLSTCLFRLVKEVNSRSMEPLPPISLPHFGPTTYSSQEILSKKSTKNSVTYTRLDIKKIRVVPTP